MLYASSLFSSSKEVSLTGTKCVITLTSFTNLPATVSELQFYAKGGN